MGGFRSLAGPITEWKGNWLSAQQWRSCKPSVCYSYRAAQFSRAYIHTELKLQLRLLEIHAPNSRNTAQAAFHLSLIEKTAVNSPACREQCTAVMWRTTTRQSTDWNAQLQWNSAQSVGAGGGWRVLAESLRYEHSNRCQWHTNT